MYRVASAIEDNVETVATKEFLSSGSTTLVGPTGKKRRSIDPLFRRAIACDAVTNGCDASASAAARGVGVVRASTARKWEEEEAMASYQAAAFLTLKDSEAFGFGVYAASIGQPPVDLLVGTAVSLLAGEAVVLPPHDLGCPATLPLTPSYDRHPLTSHERKRVFSVSKRGPRCGRDRGALFLNTLLRGRGRLGAWATKYRHDACLELCGPECAPASQLSTCTCV